MQAAPSFNTSELLRMLAAEGQPCEHVAAAVAARCGDDVDRRAWLGRTLTTLLRDGLLYSDTEKMNAAYLLRYAASDASGAREPLLRLNLPASGEPQAVQAWAASLAGAADVPPLQQLQQHSHQPFGQMQPAALLGSLPPQQHWQGGASMADGAGTAPPRWQLGSQASEGGGSPWSSTQSSPPPAPPWNQAAQAMTHSPQQPLSIQQLPALQLAPTPAPVHLEAQWRQQQQQQQQARQAWHVEQQEEARQRHEEQQEEARQRHEEQQEEARQRHEEQQEEARQRHEEQQEEARQRHEEQQEEARQWHEQQRQLQGLLALLEQAVEAPLIPAFQQQLVDALRGPSAPALTAPLAAAVGQAADGAVAPVQPQHMRSLTEHNSAVAAELLLALTAHHPEAAAVFAAAVAQLPMSAQSVECLSAVVDRSQLPDWVLTTFLSNCMQDTNASQDAGRQSRQVKLLCAHVALVLQRQPATLAESLPELLSFCIQQSRHKQASELYRQLRDLEQAAS